MQGEDNLAVNDFESTDMKVMAMLFAWGLDWMLVIMFCSALKFDTWQELLSREAGEQMDFGQSLANSSGEGNEKDLAAFQKESIPLSQLSADII